MQQLRQNPKSSSSVLGTNYDRFWAEVSQFEVGKSINDNEVAKVGMALDSR